MLQTVYAPALSRYRLGIPSRQDRSQTSAPGDYPGVALAQDTWSQDRRANQDQALRGCVFPNFKQPAESGFPISDDGPPSMMTTDFPCALSPVITDAWLQNEDIKLLLLTDIPKMTVRRATFFLTQPESVIHLQKSALAASVVAVDREATNRNFSLPASGSVDAEFIPPLRT